MSSLVSFSLPTSIPCIIAHRGASAAAPENTLPAFVLAQRLGADMIELDVQRAADGTLVVFHDATTERWDGRPRPVQHCSLAELRLLDIGGAEVPTLDEVCAFARDCGIALNVEIKQADCAAAVVALLRRYDLSQQVLVSSFYAAALRDAQQHAPEMARAYLMGTRSYHPTTRLRELWPFSHLRRVGARAWHPSDELPFLRWVLPLVRRAGYGVNVWTVDTPARMRQLVAWGATGIITNDPALARATLCPPSRPPAQQT